MRVVIIDDELLIVKALTATLTRAGYTVVGTAGALARGQQLINETEFDLAIVDANLNGASAQPLLEQLATRSIPTLLMSGYSESQRPDWARNARYLSKPFAPEELIAAIGEMSR